MFRAKIKENTLFNIMRKGRQRTFKIQGMKCNFIRINIEDTRQTFLVSFCCLYRELLLS